MKHSSRFSVHPGWKVLMADIGINSADVLTLAGLPPDLFSQRDASLSVNDYFNFWDSLEKIAHGVEVPLRLAGALSAESFDPPIFASLCSPNLNVALRRLKQYKPLIGPIALDVETNDVFSSVTISCYKTELPIPRLLSATELVFFVQVARMATRHHIIPKEVVCSVSLSQPNLYKDYFGVEVKSGNVNRVSFRVADAQRPFLTENAGMWNFFEPELKKRLSKLLVEASTQQRVKSALLELLPSGQVSIDHVAGKLAVSKRTLQRKLSSEQSSFQSVLNATRQELAQHYLNNSGMSSGEISFLLGFQDSTSFYRAFNSWTGQTPEQYRMSAVH